MSPDHVGWVGTVFFAISGFLIAHKRRSSFLYMFAGNAAYAVVGLLTVLPSLVTVSVIMGAIDIYGWYKWSPTAINR